MSMPAIEYTIEYRSLDMRYWTVSGVVLSRDVAVALAAQMIRPGVMVRVVSNGHTDGVARYEYQVKHRGTCTP